MVYRKALVNRLLFRNLPLWAAFNFSSSPSATPLIKDSRTTYRKGGGESVVVDSTADAVIRRFDLGRGVTGLPDTGAVIGDEAGNLIGAEG